MQCFNVFAMPFELCLEFGQRRFRIPHCYFISVLRTLLPQVPLLLSGFDAILGVFADVAKMLVMFADRCFDIVLVLPRNRRQRRVLLRLNG